MKDRIKEKIGFWGKYHEVNYHKWQCTQEQNFLNHLDSVQTEMADWSLKPLVSIIMPTFNTNPVWLKDAVRSVLVQPYTNWELIVTDDASTNSGTRTVLQEIAQWDRRIRVIANWETRGISGNTNLGLEATQGELVTFLDHDDILTPNALYEVVKAFNISSFDIFYSDEDKLNETGVFEDAFFKPDYSPDYLLSCNYFNHLTVYRTKILHQTGFLRTEFDGAQDYDLLLRAVELTEKIEHIPTVLYHWRKVPGSTAASFSSKSYADESGRRAVESAMARRQEAASVKPTVLPGHYRIQREIHETPLVSIIIPIRDKVDLLKRCVASIGKSTYQNYEIIIVDNGSEMIETLDYLKSISGSCRVHRLDIPFNYSRLNNIAARESNGDILLFVNSDIEVTSPDWMEEMLQYALHRNVGAVGARLLYPDGRVQHSGIVLGIGGVAGHGHKFFPRHSVGYFGNLVDVRNVSAVTGACMMVRKNLFEEVGGFDEINLPVSFNDVDLCLRIRQAGYLCVFTPHAELYHFESATRGSDLDDEEVWYMQKTWNRLLGNDPYYNPHLSLTREDYSFDL